MSGLRRHGGGAARGHEVAVEPGPALCKSQPLRLPYSHSSFGLRKLVMNQLPPEDAGVEGVETFLTFDIARRFGHLILGAVLGAARLAARAPGDHVDVETLRH